MVSRWARGSMTDTTEIAGRKNLAASWPLPGGALFSAFVFLAALLTMAVALQLAPGILSLPASRVDAPTSEGLIALHRAGEMARSGEAAAAYDPQLFRAGLSSHQQEFLWLTPPHAFLLITPATAASYDATKLLWLIAIIGCFVGGLRIAGARANGLIPFAVLSPGLLISLLSFQLGPFLALALAAALLAAPTRPLISGALLGLVSVAPQYGLMAPFFLAATGRWRVLIAAAASTAILVAVSAALFGVEAWAAFFGALATSPTASQISEGSVAPSHAAELLGVAETPRLILQAGCMLICGAVALLAARMLPARPAIGVTLLMTLIAAPSATIYDWPLLIAALGFLVAKTSWPISVQIAAGAAWAAPVLSYFFDSAYAQLAAPLSLAALTVFSAHWLLRPRLKATTPVETPAPPTDAAAPAPTLAE